jgi:4-hydroxy-tetrahydrodipicolinate reductase
MHHARKQDAPSGTALALGQAVAESRGSTLPERAVFARIDKVGPRQPGEIGFAVLRGGDVAGEHTVLFSTAGERLEITHRAASRDIFARGALVAALWIAHREPRVYSIDEVLSRGSV